MSKADLVVLGFLNHKPMHGYEILQWLKIHHLETWAEVKLPSVYKSLQRLNEQGFIKGETEYDGNKPPRTIFSINEKGIYRFRKLLKQFLAAEKCSSKDFWTAIAMMKKGIEKSEFLIMLNNRLTSLETYYHNFISEIEQMKNDSVQQKIPYYDVELMNMGRKIIRAELEALKNLQILTESEENNIYFLTKENE
jgi:DNA-binding PadR family transcriptional regulator